MGVRPEDRLHSEASHLLDRIGPPAGQFLEIRTIAPDTGTVRQVFCSSLGRALEVVARVDAMANVYVGACPRSRRDGRREAVTVVPAAWADLDFHQIEPDDRDRALAVSTSRIERLGMRPTALVHTGNGLQAWWIYQQPVSISSDFPFDRFEAINRGLGKVLGGDAVHDLARVLRVPGTWNLPDTKKRVRGCVPVRAQLLYFGGSTYLPDDFDYLAVAESTTERRKRTNVTDVASPTQPAEEIIDAFGQFLAQLGSGHPLTRTWCGNRILKDSSRSGWDMALVNQLRRARVREEFVPAIVRAFRHGRGVFATDDYIGRTMAKARVRRSKHEAPRSA